MTIWHSEDLPEKKGYGISGVVRAFRRVLTLAVVIYGGLIIFFAVRLIEFPWGRVTSPWIASTVSRLSLYALGIRFRTRGLPMNAAGAVVVNHVSWLDILSLNANQRIHFVAKSEIRNWFGIGILAKATGVTFIDRNPLRARSQMKLLSKRFKKGDKLLFFPEGTSTDGLRVISFKSSLFAALFEAENLTHLSVQPVTVNYRAPHGEDARFYGWWGDMEMGPHLYKILSVPTQGGVELVFHEPVTVAEFTDRKELAKYCETTVRHGLTSGC